MRNDDEIDHERAHDVTVVITAWDTYARDFLASALASVASQRPQPVIVVVDNASCSPVDGGAFTVVRCAERRTIGTARNLGLDAVETPYVLFWDADDVMLPGTIARLLEAMRADGGLAAVGTRILEDDGTYHHWPRLVFQRLARWPAVYAAVHAVSSLYPTIGSMLRTDLLRAGGGFPDIDESDDWVAGVSIALRGRVRILDHPGRMYHLHGDSVSARYTTADRLWSARNVRMRLRREPSLPAVLRAVVPVLAPLHWLIVLVLRPLRLHARSLARTRARHVDAVACVAPGSPRPVELRRR